jgi:hypothetical protein
MILAVNMFLLEKGYYSETWLGHLLNNGFYRINTITLLLPPSFHNAWDD